MPATRNLAAAGLLTIAGALGTAAAADAEAPQGREHWAVQLGARVLVVEQAFPLIDRVVLVPDAATYLDEISRWSPRGQWPVLIEDRQYAPMFLRRFRPAEVIRRESVEPSGEHSLQERVERAVIRTWGGVPGRHSVAEVFDAARPAPPPGIVIASSDDPAWTAAVALAAGRGQPIAWIDLPAGQPDLVIERDEADRFGQRIVDALDSLPWPYEGLGQGINTITVCRTMAGRVNLPQAQAPEGSRAGTWRRGGDGGIEIEPAALTDYLGRRPAPPPWGPDGPADSNGERFAFVGWIYGDEVRSAYIAMCSLFLPRTNVLLHNSYPISGQEWAGYGILGAAAILAERGFEVVAMSGPRASLPAWFELLVGGITTDVVAMNSRGSPFRFELARGDASPLDVPILNTPAAVHLTHSWSMRQPDDVNTVAGRWLMRGAYAFVGSVHEPYLHAFIPPESLARRWVSLAPFHVAARHWDEYLPFSGPWKVNTFGDPLMLVASPLDVRRPRTEQAAGYGVNLLEEAERLMREAAADDRGEVVAAAMELLVLLGRDEVALGLWRLARQRGLAERAAPPALGPLFRAGDADGFLLAWSLLPHGTDRDAHAREMLWHLFTPRLDALRDEDELLRLQAAIRPEMPHVDLSRLAPHLARVFGTAHVRNLIEREMDHAPNRRSRRALRDLLEQEPWTRADRR